MRVKRSVHARKKRRATLELTPVQPIIGLPDDPSILRTLAVVAEEFEPLHVGGVVTLGRAIGEQYVREAARGRPRPRTRGS